ncbi:deoxyribodipyrimidine photo-lyase [Desulfosediminicola ganghwensis]|uniref:deoxyribodipyrimidine photo-lyase n=1 Tax=Desulfosediminicola ganghwensis TaxID=2569540 RepID=UPI0010AC54F1|nr:deoxyribodipyrimidine photo-lyase [Desulfosediminicola ganghwensis]
MVERFRVDQRRVKRVRKGHRGEGPVLYWMNRDQRVEDNWALLQSQDLALSVGRPLLVVFCLPDRYLSASARNFWFTIVGLEEIVAQLARLNIDMRILYGSSVKAIANCANSLDAYAVVTDFNPLKIRKRWLFEMGTQVRVPVYEVDAHNIIPCWYASDKQEYAAYTFRPKVARLLPIFLNDFPEVKKHPYRVENLDKALAPPDWPELYARYPDTDSRESYPRPGSVQAKEALKEFIAKRLNGYDRKRNDPLAEWTSRLSPYLHFGQVSPQRVALAVQAAAGIPDEDKDAFLEELIVRRELSDNFCYYCDDYDSVDGFPAWAIRTLDEHRHDQRKYVYTEEEFIFGKTHEPLWNSCQNALRETGRLHGYLRMYWAKKILEWSAIPEEALRIGNLLNDTFAFDGRDPNGYTGVSWAIGGVHDRAWKERPVFGKIRYMNEAGCRRKFAVDDYIAKYGGEEQ